MKADRRLAMSTTDMAAITRKAKGRKGAATHAQCIAAVEVLEQRVFALSNEVALKRDMITDLESRIGDLHNDLRVRTGERDEADATSLKNYEQYCAACTERDEERRAYEAVARQYDAMRVETEAFRQGMEDHRAEAIRARAEAESLRQSLAKSMAQTDEALGTARNAVATAGTARAEADEAEASAAGWEQMHHKAQQKVGQWKASASLLWELARKGDIAGATSVAGVVFGAKE